MSIEKKAYMICPVRKITKKEKKFLDNYVAQGESLGYSFHYPLRNVNQDDDLTGLTILSKHRKAMKKSDFTFIYFNPTSEATAFDLGMMFIEEKPLITINLEDVIQKNTKNELQRFIMKYSKSIAMPEDFQSNLYQKMLKRKDEIKKSKLIEYEWKENNIDFLFDFGMAFMAEKPIILSNRDEVERTPHKSFQNVLLELDKKNGKIRNLF